jgi:hypothetical protein
MKIFRPLVVILLILQVSTAYALPAGVHINLCFGFDGHFDISSDLCAATSLPLPLPQACTVLFNQDHHDECQNVVISHVSSEEPRPPNERNCSAKTMPQSNNWHSTTTNYFYSFSFRTLKSPIRTSSPPNSEAFLPSPLDSLRTVVLLI